MSHAGKGVGPYWCLSLVPQCGLNATIPTLLASLLPISHRILELEKVRAPAQSPPCGKSMMQNTTSQHAEGICVKKLFVCTQGREAQHLSETQNVGKKPAFP